VIEEGGFIDRIGSDMRDDHRPPEFDKNTAK